jgi:hypothetical protein
MIGAVRDTMLDRDDRMKSKMHYVTCFIFGSSVLMAMTFTIACSPNETILNSNSAAGSSNANQVAAKKDPVEEEVENMQTANFDYIFVLRRKDGGQISDDDKAFIRNVTGNANRRSLSDDDKAVVIGSNSPPSADFITRLSTRFDVEDRSQIQPQNYNANSPANANIGH